MWRCKQKISSVYKLCEIKEKEARSVFGSVHSRQKGAASRQDKILRIWPKLELEVTRHNVNQSSRDAH